MAIYFYKVGEPYGCFSNFSPHPFFANGYDWPTSEHYFQAHKFVGTPVFDMIRNATGPMNAAKLGRHSKYPLRNDWELVKDAIMKEAVKAKFSAHPDIAEVMLGTGSDLIVERTTTDKYWGCGSDGTGKNLLGLILMEVRDELKLSRKLI